MLPKICANLNYMVIRTYGSWRLMYVLTVNLPVFIGTRISALRLFLYTAFLCLANSEMADVKEQIICKLDKTGVKSY